MTTPTRDDLAEDWEMDAEVAEQVMGLRVERGDVPRSYGNTWVVIDSQGNRSRMWDHAYGSDIVAAMQIVEHMNQRGHYWELSQALNMPYGDLIWQADVRRWDTVLGYRGTAQSLPLAIRRAALKTVSDRP
jgi:Phage ABA sandwich domain